MIAPADLSKKEWRRFEASISQKGFALSVQHVS